MNVLFYFIFLILVSYQSPCSNLYAVGRNRLHEDPRSICSAPGDLTWFCSCFPAVNRRFSFVLERRCGAVSSDCHHCIVSRPLIDRSECMCGGRGWLAGGETLGKQKKIEKCFQNKLMNRLDEGRSRAHPRDSKDWRKICALGVLQT